MNTILDALVGTGLKPMVWNAGTYQPQIANEGIPIIFIGGSISTLLAIDYLII